MAMARRLSMAARVISITFPSPPIQMNARILAAVDTTSEPFKLAKALLTGEDLFGADFIMAHREGKLGGE